MIKTGSHPQEKHYALQENYQEGDVDHTYEKTEASITFDDILSKVGFGSYQLKAYFILGLILINDGAEAVVLSLLQNILKNEWSLTLSQNSSIGTGVFIGFLIGSLLSGKLADRLGRRRPLIFTIALLYISALASAFVKDYTSLVAVRAIYGLLVGIQFPICFSYLAEITPKEVRGKYLVLAGGFFTLGELLTCLVGSFTLGGVSSGNWRLLLIWIAQPALICWLGVTVFIHESPRYLITVRKEFEQGVEILNRIIQTNSSDLSITEKDIKGLIEWTKSSDALKSQEKASISVLFNTDTRAITICLWPIWFVLCLTYYGMVFILPEIIEVLNSVNHKKDLWSITLPVFGELPSIIVGYLIIENANFGRRKSIIAGFGLGALLCLFAGVAPYFEVWVTGVRMVLNGVFIIVPAYTTELYSTPIRATGLGMASAFSRLGGAATTWMTQALFNIAPKAPFLGFSVLCLLGGYCCYMIPYDTTNKELDFVDTGKHVADVDTIEKD